MLRVASTKPGQRVDRHRRRPASITVTFNKPVVFSTVSAADLTFTSHAGGRHGQRRRPIAVDNPTVPTIVEFPISFTKPAGVAGQRQVHASRSRARPAARSSSEDGKDLVAIRPRSRSRSPTSPRRRSSTPTVNGRIVTIQFSKAIDPATVTLGNIFVIRQGRRGGVAAHAGESSPRYINLNNDPRATISYNPLDLHGDARLQQPAPDRDAVGQLRDRRAQPSDPRGVRRHRPGRQPARRLLHRVVPDHGHPGQARTTSSRTSASRRSRRRRSPRSQMSPTSTDTGIPGDQNTNNQPAGRSSARSMCRFPGTVAGVQVFVEFNGLQRRRPSTLGVGGGGRGFVGAFDVQVTTNATRRVHRDRASALPEGFQAAVAVVVGQPDQPPLPGLASDATPTPSGSTRRRPRSPGPRSRRAAPPCPCPTGPPPNITNVSGLSTLSLERRITLNPRPARPWRRPRSSCSRRSTRPPRPTSATTR